MTRIVFDTSVILSYTLREPRSGGVKEWLRRVAKGEAIGLVSTVTVCEIFEKLARVNNKEAAIILLDRLKRSGIVVMEVTEEIARLAGPLKVQFPQLSTADAIIFSTAVVNKAVLYTFDRAFQQIGGVDVIGIEEK